MALALQRAVRAQPGVRAPLLTFLTVSSSRCLFSLAAWSSFICRSSSSCSASSFFRRSLRPWRASLCGGGLPSFSRWMVEWMAVKGREKAQEMPVTLWDPNTPMAQREESQTGLRVDSDSATEDGPGNLEQVTEVTPWLEHQFPHL